MKWRRSCFGHFYTWLQTNRKIAGPCARGALDPLIGPCPGLVRIAPLPVLDSHCMCFGRPSTFCMPFVAFVFSASFQDPISKNDRMRHTCNFLNFVWDLLFALLMSCFTPHFSRNHTIFETTCCSPPLLGSIIMKNIPSPWPTRLTEKVPWQYNNSASKFAKSFANMCISCLLPLLGVNSVCHLLFHLCFIASVARPALGVPISWASGRHGTIEYKTQQMF